jgi:hypothetical protein
VAYVRTVNTASGAIAVQIVWSTRRGWRQIEHLGSAHDEAEVEALKAAARQCLAEGQCALDLGLNTAGVDGEPLEIVGSKASHVWDGLCRAYRVLGFDTATGADEVFRDLVLARIIEPTSKADSLRVIAETDLEPDDYRTVTRRLPMVAKPSVRQALSAACADRAGLGPASLVLYDVSTPYFETDTGDGFREPGFCKQRRLEPQITIGLLTDATGFPLAVEAFRGQQSRDRHHAAGHQRLQDRPLVDRRRRGRRCWHDLRGQSDRPAGLGIVVHPRHPNPVRARCRAGMA